MCQSASSAPVGDGLPDQGRPKVGGMYVANCPYRSGHGHAFNNLYVTRGERRDVHYHLTWYRASNAQVRLQRNVNLRWTDF
jgi:hypothetical protein